MGAQGARPVVGLPSRNVGWGVRIRLLKDAGAKVKGIPSLWVSTSLCDVAFVALGWGTAPSATQRGTSSLFLSLGLIPAGFDPG